MKDILIIAMTPAAMMDKTDDKTDGTLAPGQLIQRPWERRHQGRSRRNAGIQHQAQLFIAQRLQRDLSRRKLAAGCQ